jgi:hypothetical protein
MRKFLIGLIAIGCAGCGAKQVSEQEAAAANGVMPAAVQPVSVKPGEPGGMPDERNLVVKDPIDPNTAQGAGQVLQQFAALLEQKRFGEARALGQQDFTVPFVRDAEIHAEVGAPGAIEGAAGSTYVDIPIRFYGKHADGTAFSQAANATLRRVNDVPGSTAAQRRWRIYRLEMQPAT